MNNRRCCKYALHSAVIAPANIDIVQTAFDTVKNSSVNTGFRRCEVHFSRSAVRCREGGIYLSPVIIFVSMIFKDRLLAFRLYSYEILSYGRASAGVIYHPAPHLGVIAFTRITGCPSAIHIGIPCDTASETILPYSKYGISFAASYQLLCAILGRCGNISQYIRPSVCKESLSDLMTRNGKLILSVLQICISSEENFLCEDPWKIR